MALTVVQDKDPLTQAAEERWGTYRVRRGTITFDSSYPTNGEAVTHSTFGFDAVLADVLVFPSGGEIPVWDKANSKIKLFTADGTEASNASDQSAVVIRYVAFGR